MFLLPLIGLSFYNLIENELILNFNKKKAYNYISCIHIIFVIVTYALNYNYQNHITYNLSVLNSTGYFINDILFLIKNRKFKMKDLIYLYHHTISVIYIIYQPEHSYSFIWLFAAEISNIPGHIVYHYIKTKNKNNFQIEVKNTCEKIQVFVYGFIRVIYLSYISYLEYNIEKNNFQKNIYNLSIPLFIMGWLYSYVLVKKICCVNNNNNEKNQ